MTLIGIITITPGFSRFLATPRVSLWVTGLSICQFCAMFLLQIILAVQFLSAASLSPSSSTQTLRMLFPQMTRVTPTISRLALMKRRWFFHVPPLIEWSCAPAPLPSPGWPWHMTAYVGLMATLSWVTRYRLMPLKPTPLITLPVVSLVLIRLCTLHTCSSPVSMIIFLWPLPMMTHWASTYS